MSKSKSEYEYKAELMEKAWNEGISLGIYRERMECLQMFFDFLQIPEKIDFSYYKGVPIPNNAMPTIDDSMDPEKMAELYITMKYLNEIDTFREQAAKEAQENERIRIMETLLERGWNQDMVEDFFMVNTKATENVEE